LQIDENWKKWYDALGSNMRERTKMTAATGVHVEVEADSTRERYTRLYRYAQIGRCVSSVTHDVNNYLGAIMAYAELVGMDGSLNVESKRMLSEIIGAVRKSSSLVNNLTDVARKERADIRIIDPVNLMERVLDLRRYDMKVGHVTLVTDYAPGLGNFTVDLPTLQQAIMYIVSNAIEALDLEKVKRVEIRIKPDGDSICFSFRDSAPPIPPSCREKMFEPYFTTKGIDHTGLGLTIARATVEDHDGSLVYTPEEGFLIRIPVENRYSLPA
jgi:two-component system C4-dicarboxylate transport sensor histidine kinase DctB